MIPSTRVVDGRVGKSSLPRKQNQEVSPKKLDLPNFCVSGVDWTVHGPQVQRSPNFYASPVRLPVPLEAAQPTSDAQPSPDQSTPQKRLGSVSELGGPLTSGTLMTG